MSPSRGLLMIHTGSGKGKTTAALGLALRAWGHGLRPAVLQFVKSSDKISGEALAAQKLDIPFRALGGGFSWVDNGRDHRQLAVEAWKTAQTWISGGEYDLIVLDEFTYPLHFGWLDTGEVMAWLRSRRPPHLHLVITGRYAPEQLIEAADLVTDMKEVKHPLRQQKIRAQMGIEY